MAIESPELVNSLANCLGNTVVFYFKAHGHHWNVQGSDFSEFHSFFEAIYEDVYEAIDPMAENLRKLGAPAPYKLAEFARLSDIKDGDIGVNAMSMVQDLLDNNEILIKCLKETFDVTQTVNEQGIANFIAERIDMHEKWRWQLSSYLVSPSASAFGI